MSGRKGVKACTKTTKEEELIGNEGEKNTSCVDCLVVLKYFVSAVNRFCFRKSYFVGKITRMKSSSYFCLIYKDIG